MNKRNFTQAMVVASTVGAFAAPAAKEGMRYTQGYTAHPRCLPERGKPIFWHSPTSRPYSTGDNDSSAVRIGDYKLLEWYNADHVELYNLAEDIGELNDRSKTMPEKTAEMLKVLHNWRKEINAHTREQSWTGGGGEEG